MGGVGPMGVPMQPMAQDPINALQSMTKVPGGHQVMHQQRPMGQPQMGGGMMMPGQSTMGHVGGQMVQGGGAPMMQQRPPFQNYQQVPGGHRAMNPAMHGQGYGQHGMVPQHAQGMTSQGQFVGGPNMMGGQMGMRQQPQAQHYPQNMPYANTGLSPSPMSAHSPAMMPSPSQGAMAPSPMQMARNLQVPSPGNVNLNTPNSGPVPTPPDGRTGDELYQEKLKSLQRYVEPLRRMINKVEKVNDRRKENVKMKNLLEILTDGTRRYVGMETLCKCQAVLEKLESEFFQNSLPAAAADSIPLMSVAKPGSQQIGQNLLNRIASQINMPMFNHTLKRTFGPAVEALYGAPIEAPQPPPKKAKCDDTDDAHVSYLLQGEIARLRHKFIVDLDPLYHNQSKCVHLICKLEDKNLPTVPPIAVTVPENYPETSPQCETDTTGYDTTSFLLRVQKNLTSHLNGMPSRYSVTALLNIWEMSVRKASVVTSPSS